MKTTCPRCDLPLQPERRGEILDHTCSSCGGHALTLAALRKAGEEAGAKTIWRLARGAPDGDLPCPSCRRPMAAVHLSPEDLADAGASDAAFALALDACRACVIIWFDDRELERLAGELALAGPSSAEREADGLLARMKIQEDQKRERTLRNTREASGLLQELFHMLLL